MRFSTSILRQALAFSTIRTVSAPRFIQSASIIRPSTSTFQVNLIRSSMPNSIFSALFGSSSSSGNSMSESYPVQKTEDEWRAVLNPEQFRIIRQKGTEPATSGKYDSHYPTVGTYNCAACDAPLYTADQKFKSGCGWPAFFDTVPGAVKRFTDKTWGMSRTEIVCANCGGHLGHVFKGEGFKTPTDERHCVNSVSLKFDPNDKPVEKPAEGKAESSKV